MVKPLLLLAAFAFAAAAPLPGKTMGNYTFTLDGKDYEPGTYCLEMGDEPVPGDVIQVGILPVTLEEPGRYDLHWEDDGFLYRVLADGSKVLIACRVFNEEPDDDAAGAGRLKRKGGLVNPLAKLNDEALRQIRGVSLAAWPDDMGGLLGRLDLDKVCIHLERNVAQGEGRALPPVPERLRHLMVSSSGHNGYLDFTRLKALSRLRFLDISGAGCDQFNFSLLQGLPLEYLSLPWVREARGVEVIGSLRSLKTLEGNGSNYLGKADWVAGLPELRQFYASQISGDGETKPVPLELSALNGLAKLRAIHVALSPVASLPDKHLPQLTKATLMLSKVDEDAVRKFAAANPQCEVRRSMNATLAKALQGADRMRARTGGLCHRRESEETTIGEARDPALVREMAQHMEVRDDQGGFHCMCCGSPTFEFYRGAELIAAIGFHHGQSIRWGNGLWPGDAALTERSADFLIEWLDRNGHSKPKQERIEARRRSAADERRYQRYQALVPKGLMDAWDDAEDADTMTKALENQVPDLEARTLLLLKLLGCDNGTWTKTTGFEEVIVDRWLPAVPEATLLKVVAGVKPLSEEGQGAARWIFGRGNLTPWQAKWEVLEPLAKFSMTHPRQANRWRALEGLRDLGGEPSRQLLMAVVRGDFKVRELPDEDLYEPEGSQTFYPNAITLPDGASDALAAALCLAELEDVASRSAVGKLKSAQPEALRAAFDKELAEYRERQKRKD